MSLFSARYVSIMKILSMTLEITSEEDEPIQRLNSFSREYEQSVRVWRATSSITIYQHESIQKTDLARSQCTELVTR